MAPTLGAGIGTLGALAFRPGFVGVLVVAFAAMLSMRLLRVTTPPVLAVAILPLVFGVRGIDFGDGGEGLPRAMRALERHDIRVRTLDAELEGSRARYTIRVRLSPNHSAREALGEISALPGVERVALAGLHGLE